MAKAKQNSIDVHADAESCSNRCHICFEEMGQRACQVCACRGTAGCAHEECLIMAASAEWPRLDRWCWCMTCKQEYIGHAREALALALWKRVEGRREGDAHRCWAANNLASTFYAQGRYTEAAELHMQTLSVERETLGAEHPDALTSASNLASTLHAQGLYGEAVSLHQTILKVRSRTLGSEHPDTLRSICNLASTLYAQGDYEQAAELQSRALEAQRKIVGREHPQTLRSCSNLVSTYYAQGRFEEAVVLQSETWQVQRRVLGAEHPETLKSASNLASTFCALKRFAEAAELHQVTWDIRKRALGPEHPDSLTSASNLAIAMRSQGLDSQAVKLHRETLEVQCRVLGAEHPNTLTSASNLANTLHAQGHHEEAAQLQRETLGARRRVLGSAHPQTLRSLQSLASAASFSFVCGVAHDVSAAVSSSPPQRSSRGCEYDDPVADERPAGQHEVAKPAVGLDAESLDDALADFLGVGEEGQGGGAILSEREGTMAPVHITPSAPLFDDLKLDAAMEELLELPPLSTANAAPHGDY